MSDSEIPAGAELLTYAEAGARLGIDPESVKRRAQRGGWVRQLGNDGRTRVAIPADALPPEGETVTPDKPAPLPPLAELVAELQRQAAALEAARELAAARLAELERLREATAELVRYHRPLPPGFRVLRLGGRAGAFHWRRLADGVTSQGFDGRWSAWRGAWAEHRRLREAARS